MKKPFTFALALTLLALVPGTTLASTAVGAVKANAASASARPDFDPNVSDFQPYSALADAVTQRASDLAERLDHVKGFAGVAISAAQNDVTLRWNGRMPDAAVTVVNDLSRRGPSVPVHTLAANYSSDYLNEIAREASLLQDPTLKSPWTLSAFAKEDSSGIVLGTSKQSGLLSMSPQAVSELLNIPVPVSVELGGSPANGATDLDRQLDTGLFQGGARIDIMTQSCTSGFTVYDQKADTRAMLTAEHCGAVGDAVTNDGNFKGYIRRENGARDVAIIRDGPQGYGASVYVGNWYSGNMEQQGKVLTPTDGMVGVSSGSFSGELKGITIKAVAEYEGGDGPFIRGVRTNTGGAAGGGDSGGPFMRYVWDDAIQDWRVRPLGIVSRGVPGYEMNSDSCAGVATRCYSQVRFSNLDSATSAMEFNISVN